MTSRGAEGFEELLSITAELARLEESDPRRPELEQRRNELRAAARAAQLSDMSPDALRAEKKRLEQRLAELESEKIRVPKWQEHTGGVLTDPEAAGRNINKMIDRANAPEVISLERRLVEIDEALGERFDGET